jgi:RNA polymerase sigma factor (TIGR02999 family)
MAGRENITRLLVELSDGNRTIVDRLTPLVYDELRAIAHRQLLREARGRTLDTYGLVHEAYIKLVDQRAVTWRNRAHFFSIASLVMRRILTNEAKKRLAQKRGGGHALATFNDDLYSREVRAEDVVALDEALSRLGQQSERQSKIVSFRFFGGLNHKEIAEVLDLSVSTVRLDWRLARAWLGRELRNMGIQG